MKIILTQHSRGKFVQTVLALANHTLGRYPDITMACKLEPIYFGGFQTINPSVTEPVKPASLAHFMMLLPSSLVE